jgi:predicted double-glycine peptidase
MLEKSKIKESSNPRYVLKKLLQDIDNLEKFYTDREYRNRLVSTANYPSSEYFQLEDIYEQEKKVKEKLNLPQNSIIKYEKVKCSKNCRHNNPPHKYYYAYIWDCNSKKLKKKYIGKQLPLPASFNL